jgi:hypothetical protein
MSVLPNLAGLSWPRTVNAGDFKSTDPTVFKMAIHFVPGANPEETPTTLKIYTNDNSLPGGVFTFSVVPEERIPELVVNPPNYVFLNASSTTSDTVDIVLSNGGTEALALGGIDFLTASSAYSIIGVRPLRDTIVDPTDSGAGNDPVTLTVEYRPFEPPDDNQLVIQWGKVAETGVSCTGDSTCTNDQGLCGKAGKTCPYRCGNGHCMCANDEDCAAYECEEGAPCEYVCLTGVCRIPQKSFIELSGKSQAGQLKVEYADRLVGCVDFTQVLETGASCTKLVQLSNVAEGLVKLQRPTTRISVGTENPYSVKWYRMGASQPEACGAVTGTELSENQFGLTQQNGPVNVAVTYTAPEKTAPIGELVISYSSPFAGEEVVSLCGGTKRGELEVAPPISAPMVMFAPEPSRKATKTVILMNKGNDTLELRDFVASPMYPGTDPECFRVVNPPTGADLLMPPGALMPLTVEFDGTLIEVDENSDAIVLNGILYINYYDLLLGGDAQQKVNLIGWVNVKDVTLPVADPGTVVGAKAGSPLLLDGSASTGGTFTIDPISGYTWFISSKPATSKIFTNPGPGPAALTVIPDVQGAYEFKLVVFSYDSDSGLSFFSDESVLGVQVAP